jgi:curved DNA-binding protein CbpA
MDQHLDTDLSEVERIKIDRTFDRLQRLNYYEILNLPTQANRAQIKKNYYTVSKEYHPDRYFRRNLGAYKEKLETIFDLITKAYNTLNDDAARAEYDRSLIEGEFQRGPLVHEVSFDFGFGAPPPAAGGIRVGEQAGPLADPAGPAGSAASSDGGTQPVRRPTPAPVPEGARPVFMDKLQRQVMERMLKAREYLRIGKEAFEKGQFAIAANNLQMAATFDPNSQEARQLFEKASSRVKEGQAEGHYQRGLQEFMVGNIDNARQYLKMAVDCKPKKGYYYFKLGMLYLDNDQDLRQGIEQLKLAAQYDPQNVEYLSALAKAYEDARMPRNAYREYEKIVTINRGHELAQKALKRLKAVILGG